MAYDHASPPERLSSRLTPYLRTVVPLVSGVTIGVVVMVLALQGPASGVPTLVRQIAIPAAILGAAWLFRWLGSLRDVWLDGDDVLVNVGGRRVRISLREVAQIRQSRFQKTKTITLHLTRNTPLGGKVRFAPHFALTPGWTDHPVAKELRERRERLLSGGQDTNALPGTKPSP